MSTKRKKYTADFKSKLVLEVLECEQTLNEIASKYEVLPKSLRDWKKQFLDNMSLAFDKSVVVREYKETIEVLKRDKDSMAKKVGELTLERDFLEGKLKSLVSFNSRKTLIDTKHKLSLNKQLKILSINKSSYYYKKVKPFSSNEDIKLTRLIDSIHTEHPYYGTRRLSKALARLGFHTGRKLIKKAMSFMGIKALYPKVKTTIANKEVKQSFTQKYPYLLSAYKNDNNQVIIDTPNEVWSTDITYIRLEKGFAYLSAIIDWNTKKILNWKLSNTMDTHLTTNVLKEALYKYPKPKILNTDQGSQYTAYEHINILKNNNISISMDAKGRSIDNIVIERFWRSLKYENVYPSGYENIKEARLGISKYINIYNTKRLHSSIDYNTPDEVYYKGVNNIDFVGDKSLLKVG